MTQECFQCGRNISKGFTLCSHCSKDNLVRHVLQGIILSGVIYEYSTGRKVKKYEGCE